MTNSKLRAIFLLFWVSCQIGTAQPQDTLTLLFAGDIMGHTPQIKSAETGKNQQYDYSPCFKYIKPLIQKADIAIGNLELTLPGKPPYTGYPMFRSPDALADALKDAGFDLLVTANNHSNDSRGKGVIATVETVREKGFWQTGTFTDEADKAAHYPLIVEKNGFKLAFLNYTYGTNGVATEAPTIVNLIDKTQMIADLKKAKAKSPDFIIAVMHWGLEYQLKENDEQRDLAETLLQNGADLIIGSHPHVVQPIKRENTLTSDGKHKEALVVYSLGNFISNQQQPNTDGGILFQVDLIKNRGLRLAWTGDYGFIPIWRYIHREASGKKTFYTVPVSLFEKNNQLIPEMAESAKAKLKTFAAALRKRIICAEIR